MNLNPKQKKALKYCWAYLQSEDQLPPTRLIKTHMKYSSQTTAVNMVYFLLKAGLLEYNANKKFKFTKEGREIASSL